MLYNVWPSHSLSSFVQHIQTISTYSFWSSNWLVPILRVLLSSSLFFLSFSLTAHIHLIIFISVQFIFNSCSTFIGQVSLSCTATQVAYTSPFSFNENHFPARMGKYSRNFFQADIWLWLLLLNHILHLHPTYLLNNRCYMWMCFMWRMPLNENYAIQRNIENGWSRIWLDSEYMAGSI